MSHEIVLVCKAVRYFAPHDEDAFFEWIKKISSIKKFNGVYDELYLFIDSNNIPDTDLDSLIGLFYRYKIKNMNQLKVFLNEQNKSWFYENKKAYWHKKVFGSNDKNDK